MAASSCFVPPTIPFEQAPNQSAIWTPEQEHVFIHLMIDLIKKGGRKTTTFSKEGWKQLRVRFYNKTGKKYEKKQFKNKFYQLRTRYKAFKKLLAMPTGFGWNKDKKTLAAPDDVWDEYIKTNPDAKKLRKSGCPEYNQLCIIFGDTTAQSIVAGSSTQDLKSTNGEREANVGSTDDAIERSNQEGTSNDRSRKRLHSPRTPDMPNAIRLVGEASIGRTETIKNQIEHSFSITDCMKILERVEGIGDRAYFKATELLQKKGWRETFMAMSDDRRKRWLETLAEMSG